MQLVNSGSLKQSMQKYKLLLPYLFRKEKQSRLHHQSPSSSVPASTGAIPKRPRNEM